MMALMVPNLNMSWGVAPQINPQDMLAGFTGLPKAIAEYRVRKGIDAAHAVGETPSDTLLRFADSQGIGTGYQNVAEREAAEAAAQRRATEQDLTDSSRFFQEQYGRQNTSRQQALSARNRLNEFRSRYGNEIAANPALQAQEAEMIKEAENARALADAGTDSLMSQAYSMMNDERLTPARREMARGVYESAQKERSGISDLNPNTAELSRTGDQIAIKGVADAYKKSGSITRNEAESMLKSAGLPITAANIDEMYKGVNERATVNEQALKQAYEKSARSLNLATGAEGYKRAKFANQETYENYVVETADYKDTMDSFAKAKQGSLQDKLNWLNNMGVKLTVDELEGPDKGIAGLINQAINDPNSVTEKDAKRIRDRFIALGKQYNNKFNARMDRLEGK